MLRFFRQIRQRLLTDNKFSKYLLYAVGEILLVVIGILIALQVDSWNKERIAAENNKVLFQEVSDELVHNIKSIDRVIDIYIIKDSLYFQVLNKKVEKADYKEDPFLFHFPLSYDRQAIVKPITPDRASLVDDDFNELLARKSNLSKLQDSIFSELKDLYSERKISIDVDDKTIYDTQLQLRDNMMKMRPWWSGYLTKNDVNDEMIQYALTDPFYLNQLGELQLREYWHTLGMLWFRTKALNLYKKIADMLKTEKDTSLVKDIAAFEHVKGVYETESEGARFDIRGEDELKSNLFINGSPMGRHYVQQYSHSHLIIYKEKKGENWLAKIEIGKDGEVLGLTWFGDMTEVDGNRIFSKKID